SYNNVVWRPWQQDLIEFIDGSPDDRKILGTSMQKETRERAISPDILWLQGMISSSPEASSLMSSTRSQSDSKIEITSKDLQL
uniref:hypothetical protein n=1 Tax=Anaplasma marginale TaxID=770 RepID=UPI0019D6CCA0